LLELQPLVDDLATPVYATSFPGNPDLIVVVERGAARIRSYDTLNSSWATVLDLSAEAHLPQSPFQDHGGLTGLAYHPRFNQGRAYAFMFVRFVRTQPGGIVEMVIRRYTVPTGTTVANVASAYDLMVYTMTNASAGIHSSGQLHFDPRPLASGADDFHLYIAMPDASGGNLAGVCPCATIPPTQSFNAERVQSDSFLEGKLVRLPILYSYTPTPHPSLVTPTPEIVAKGLRHPFGFAVDPGDPNTGNNIGDIWIGDTGQDRPGDVHVFPAAGGGVCPGFNCKDYGWPWEHGIPGNTTNAPGPCVAPSLCPPPGGFSSETPYFATMKPTGDNWGSSPGVLIGGLRYRGQALAGSPHNMAGRYFYCLWGEDFSHVMSLDATQTTAQAIVASLVTHRVDLDMHTGSTQFDWDELHGLGVDAKGEILVVRVRNNLPTCTNGSVFRIVPQ